MLKPMLAALSLLLLAAPSEAQGVKVTLTDGSVVQGTLQGYEQGRYRSVVRLNGAR